MIEKIKNKSAYEILEILGFSEPPFNPFEIAQKIGVSVKSDLDFDKLGTEGQIYINKIDGKPELWINPIKSENRQRFTLAHEIGHLVNDVLPDLDNPIIDKYQTLYRSEIYGGIETRANQFAAQLLMPIKAIENYISELRKDNPKLGAKEAIVLTADKFEVSKQAVFHRFKNIKLIAQDYKFPF